MNSVNVLPEIKKEIQRIYGDTSDLSEEIMDSICNIHYFLSTGAENGTTDLAEIYPTKPDFELMSLWISHMNHVSGIFPHLPSLIKCLRESKGQSEDVHDYLEKLTLDIVKYKIENAPEKSGMRRFMARKMSTVTEFKGIARKAGIPFIGGAQNASPQISVPVAPHITNAKPIYRYKFPPYSAILFDSVESFGPIKFSFVLMVYDLKNGNVPIMYITSETNELAAELLAPMQQGTTSHAEPFLGIYDSHGRANLGQSANHATLDDFERTATNLMKSKLGINGTILRAHFVGKNG